MATAVSIHAPTRGATWQARVATRTTSFQSTRPRGARPSVHPTSSAMRVFQSTRPRGARLCHDLCGSTRLYVSIHAPTRGATWPHTARSGARSSFNPRAHAGRDTTARPSAACRSLFQSTRPRGARRTSPRGGAGRQGFQSTRPRGARHAIAAHGLRILGVSIHAPTRGATWVTRKWSSGSPRFNPRAHAGRDGKSFIKPVLLFVFQSTRPRGARLRPHNGMKTIRKIPDLSEPWGYCSSNTPRWLYAAFEFQENHRLSGVCEPAHVWPATKGSRAETQRMSGPFRSSTALAPTCSTLVCQFLPR